MIDYNFIPETLEWCTKHYTPPIKAYINCSEFGNCDGTNGFCWRCMEMTPYQFEMCCDENWVKTLLLSRCNTREEAAEFIENYRHHYPKRNVIEYLYELHKRAKEN